MEFFAQDPVVHPESSEWLEDIQATVADQVGEAHHATTSGFWKARKEFQCFFNRGRKTLGQLNGDDFIQIGLIQDHWI